MYKENNQLNEFDFGAAAKGLGARIRDGVMTGVSDSIPALGSYTGKAQGRIDVRNKTSELVRDYMRYLGQHRGLEASVENLTAWVSANYGQEYGTEMTNLARQIVNPTTSPTTPSVSPSSGGPRVEPTVGGAAQTATPSAPSPPTTPVDPEALARVDSERSAYNQMANANGASQNNRNYQHQVQNQIGNAIKQPQPDIRQIVQLTKELIGNAKDFGGGEKNRMKVWLRQVQKNPNVANNPKLAGFFRSMQVESITKAFNMAIYLIENSISSKRKIYEAVTRFIMNEDTVINRQQITAILGAIAPSLLGNSGRNDQTNDSQTGNGGIGSRANGSLNAAGGQTTRQPTQPSVPNTNQRNTASQPTTNNSSGGLLQKVVDATRLENNLRQARIEPSLIRTIVQAANTQKSIGRIFATLKGANLNGAAVSAILKSVT